MAKRGKGSGRSGKSLVGIIIVGIILLVGSATGLITVDWVALLSGEDPETAVSIPGQNGAETDSQPVRVEPVVAEPVEGAWYRLYFTTPGYPDEPATRAQTIVDGLIELIDSAQESLDIAIYELNLEEIGDAILAAQERGVAVRLVTDSEELEELETLIRLEEEGVPIVGDDRSSLMHNKFVVVDGRAVWTGSWNFTRNGTYRNNNHAILIRAPELAQNYLTEFEEMFSQGAFGPTSPANTPNPQLIIANSLIQTCFAPEDDCSILLVRQVGQAQQSIHFMAFSFTHDDIGQVVSDRARAGVAVRGIFETRGSETEYSEFGRMKRQKLDVVQDGNPYTFHHKVFVIDEKITVLGSFNFSGNADESNDENVLIIHNPEIAAAFLAEFERGYAQALDPPN